MKLMKGTELNVKVILHFFEHNYKLDVDIDSLFLIHTKEFIMQN